MRMKLSAVDAEHMSARAAVVQLAEYVNANYSYAKGCMSISRDAYSYSNSMAFSTSPKLHPE